MNCKHLGRTLLCLMLVCVLLVNISPIRAEASAVGVATAIGATLAVGSIFYGLGVRYAQDFDSFVFDVEMAVEHMSYFTDFITPDGMATVVSLGSGTYGVSSAFLQLCRDVIWDLYYVEESPLFGENITEYLIGNAIVDLSSTVPSAVFVTVGDWQEINSETWYTVNVATCEGEYPCPYFGVSGDLNVLTYYGKDYSVYVGDTYHRIRGISVQGYIGPYYVHSSEEGNLESLAASLISDSTEVIPSDGLAVDYVAKPSLSLAEGYPEWAANSVVIDDETYYPIAIAPSIEEMKDVKQEEVWVGIVLEDTGAGTDPSEPTEPNPLPGEGITVDILKTLFGGLSDKIEYVAYSIEEIPEILREFMQEVKEGLERLPGQFKEWFDDIRTKLQQLVSGQITLADLLSGLTKPIRDAVVDALTYLFAPSETFIKSQVESLIAKYPTSNNLFMLGTRLGDFLLNLGQTPPVIYIDLGAAEGNLLLGGTVAFLDLTWYSRYKGTVDGILGAFLWLLFAWRVWLKLPGIIGGASGTIGSILSRKEDFNDN